MNKYKIAMDKNGNKVVQISPNNGKKGFSIQTNGNFNSLHNKPLGKITPNTEEIHDIQSYLYNYEGTEHQKQIMNVKEGVLYHI